MWFAYNYMHIEFGLIAPSKSKPGNHTPIYIGTFLVIHLTYSPHKDIPITRAIADKVSNDFGKPHTENRAG